MGGWQEVGVFRDEGFFFIERCHCESKRTGHSQKKENLKIQSIVDFISETSSYLKEVQTRTAFKVARA